MRAACSCGSGPRRLTHFAVAEFGLVVPQGTANVRKLEDALLASPARPGTPQPICWSGSLKKKIDEQKGACEGGLEAEHSRGRSLDRFGSLRAGRTSGRGATSRPRGLAGSDAERGQHGRQGEARPRVSVTEHRVGRSVGETTRDGLVAGACDQASEAGGGGSGQQDGAYRLSAADEEGVLPGAGNRAGCRLRVSRDPMALALDVGGKDGGRVRANGRGQTSCTSCVLRARTWTRRGRSLSTRP